MNTLSNRVQTTRSHYSLSYVFHYYRCLDCFDKLQICKWTFKTNDHAIPFINEISIDRNGQKYFKV